jgi:hypothetical protein
MFFDTVSTEFIFCDTVSLGVVCFVRPSLSEMYDFDTFSQDNVYFVLLSFSEMYVKSSKPLNRGLISATRETFRIICI